MYGERGLFVALTGVGLFVTLDAQLARGREEKPSTWMPARVGVEHVRRDGFLRAIESERGDLVRRVSAPYSPERDPLALSSEQREELQSRLAALGDALRALYEQEDPVPAATKARLAIQLSELREDVESAAERALDDPLLRKAAPAPSKPTYLSAWEE
jgi:hypothetical protein